MESSQLAAIALLMVIAAALYSSVGHGGASAYLAIMALFAVSPVTMKPTALALNLIVSGIAAVRFIRAGQINWRLLLYFAVVAVPFAFLGGMLELPGEIYRPIVGTMLWIAALRMLWRPVISDGQATETPQLWISVPAGATIGLLSGLTGTGGGIFLSPLILLLRWESPRRISGIAASFIFANSAAGLAGNVAGLNDLPSSLPIFMLAVTTGALLGTGLGLHRLPRRRIEQALALVLIVAGAKMVLT